MSRATTRELVKVPTYPEFGLSASEREELLGDFLPFVEIVEVSVSIDDLPVCRDEHNQKFLQLAVVAKADFLVSGDADLLSLAEQSPVPILSPADFCRQLTL